MKAVKNILIYLISNGFRKGVWFLVLPVLVQILPPDGIGKIALFDATLLLLAPLVHLQLGGFIVVNYYAKPIGYINTLVSNMYWVSLFSCAVISVIIYLTRIPFQNLTGLNLNILLLVPLMGFMLNIHTQNLMIQRNKEKPVLFAFLSIAYSMVEIILILVLIKLFLLEWEGRVYAMAFTLSLFLVISSVHLVKQRLLSFKLDKDVLKRNLKFSLPLMPTVLGLAVLNQADKYFIEHYQGSSELGVYNLGYTIGMVILLISSSVDLVFVPKIYQFLTAKNKIRITDKSIVKYSYLYFASLAVLAILIWLAAILCFYFGLFPKEYRPTLKVIPYIAFGYVFWGITNVLNPYIAIAEKTMYILFSIILGVVINLILNYLLIPDLGLVGAAYSTFISFFIVMLVTAFFSNKSTKMPWLKFY